MSAPELMARLERARLRRILADWGVPPRQLDELLRHAVFGPGGVGLGDEGSECGVGLMIDERRDPELARLFDWRASVDDQTFVTEWESEGEPATARALLCPHAPEAIYAYTVRVRAPVALTRTFLLWVSRQERIVSLFGRRGMSVWLVREPAEVRERASSGTGPGADRLAPGLPVGIVSRPPAGLEQALIHVRRR